MQGRPGRKKIRDDEAIIEMFKQGYSRRAIREHFNLGSTVVNGVIHRWILKHQEEADKIVPIPDIHKPQTEYQKYKLDLGKLKALYNAHWSIKDIANEFLKSEKTIIDVLKQEGMI